MHSIPNEDRESLKTLSEKSDVELHALLIRQERILKNKFVFIFKCLLNFKNILTLHVSAFFRVV